MIAHGQLRAAGLSASTIGRWEREGRIIRLHRGTYAVGHVARVAEAHLLAAVLAAGPDATLVDRPAAGLHGLLTDNRRCVEVATPRAGGRGHAGVVAHRRTLRPDEITAVRGIPVTTVERTLLDIAATGRRGDLARALERAEELRVLDLRKLRAQIARSTGQRGVARLRAAVDALEPEDPRKIRSRFERGVLRIIETQGLPRPQVNLWLHEWEVDLHWPDLGLVVELDGWASHRTRAQFERDHERDLGLALLGYRVVRISWRQYRDDRATVVATLDALLRPRGDPRTRARA